MGKIKLSIILCFITTIVFKVSDQSVSSLNGFAAYATQLAEDICFCQQKAPFQCICEINGQNIAFSPEAAAFVAEQINTKRKKNKPPFPPSNAGQDLTGYHPLLGKLTGNEQPLKNIKLFPTYAQKIKTMFYVHALNWASSKEIHYNQKAAPHLFESMQKLKHFDKIYVITHGWAQSFLGTDYRQLRDKLLAFNRGTHSCVVLVDWAKGVSPSYGQSAANTIVVGREVAILIYFLVQLSKVKREDVHLIGFGLGAHVSHFAAEWFVKININEHKKHNPSCADCDFVNSFKRLGRITALDPSSKHFEGYPGAHVTVADGKYVDVIHTNAVREGGTLSDALYGYYGMSTAVGTVDFYPNGGHRQDGCQSKRSIEYGCDHRKALAYFTESLDDKSKTKFISVPCLDQSRLAQCIRRNNGKVKRVSSMGIDAHHYCGKGAHFLSYENHETRLTKISNEFFVNSKINSVTSNSTSSSSVIKGRKKRSKEIYLGAKQTSRRPQYLAEGVDPVTIEGKYVLNNPSCGMSRMGAAERIHHGNISVHGHHPWIVLIHLEDTRCSGSILNDNWILTAAHCFKKFPAYLSLKYNPTAEEIADPDYWDNYEMDIVYEKEGRNVFMPPDNDPCRPHQADIALIKVDTINGLPEDDQEYVGQTTNRICILTRSDLEWPYDRRQYTNIAGFGSTAFYITGSDPETGLPVFGDISADRLFQTRTLPWNEQFCHNVSVHNFNAIDTRNICYSSRETGICGGDSGAPFTREVPLNPPIRARVRSNRVIAVSVASWSFVWWHYCSFRDVNSVVARYPFVALGTKISPHVDWIKSTIVNNLGETIWEHLGDD